MDINIEDYQEERRRKTTIRQWWGLLSLLLGRISTSEVFSTEMHDDELQWLLKSHDSNRKYAVMEFCQEIHWRKTTCAAYSIRKV